MCRAIVHIATVALHLVEPRFQRVADHMLDAEPQIFTRDMLLGPMASPVDAVQTIAGKIPHRLTQGCTGNRAGWTGSTYRLALVDYGDPTALLGSGEHCLLPCGGHYQAR